MLWLLLLTWFLLSVPACWLVGRSIAAADETLAAADAASRRRRTPLRVVAPAAL